MRVLLAGESLFRGTASETRTMCDGSSSRPVEILRMVMAGVIPITWMAVAGELQRDWAREHTAKAMGEMFVEHAGGTGIAFAWEMQLLGHKASAGM